MKFTKTMVVAALPLALAMGAGAFRAPQLTEGAYGQAMYPLVARGLAAVNPFSVSLAEPIAVLLTVAAIGAMVLAVRRGWRKAALTLWAILGLAVVGFLASWGLNYARPSLAVRASLLAEDIDAREVLSAGRRAAVLTGELFGGLDAADAPSELPLSFDALNRTLDAAFERVQLPGDGIDFRPVPAKPLRSSHWLSYLGISGIFIPFTGEPSVNVLQPDPGLVIAVAHEKAHQRGITDEGEANFAAFLACAEPENPAYLRYSAYLFATRYLLSEAGRYLPAEELAAAWERLGPGPAADLRAIDAFWQRYQGPAQSVARGVNDRYLRTMRVPGGVQSYGAVVALLVALDRRNDLVSETP